MIESRSENQYIWITILYGLLFLFFRHIMGTHCISLPGFLSLPPSSGGFTITERMLGMFHRPSDPREFNELYAIPAGVLVAAVAAGSVVGGDSSFSAEGLTQVMTTIRVSGLLGVVGWE